MNNDKQIKYTVSNDILFKENIEMGIIQSIESCPEIMDRCDIVKISYKPSQSKSDVDYELEISKSELYHETTKNIQ